MRSFSNYIQEDISFINPYVKVFGKKSLIPIFKDLKARYELSRLQSDGSPVMEFYQGLVWYYDGTAFHDNSDSSNITFKPKIIRSVNTLNEMKVIFPDLRPKSYQWQFRGSRIDRDELMKHEWKSYGNSWYVSKDEFSYRSKTGLSSWTREENMAWTFAFFRTEYNKMLTKKEIDRMITSFNERKVPIVYYCKSDQNTIFNFKSAYQYSKFFGFPNESEYIQIGKDSKSVKILCHKYHVQTLGLKVVE